MRRSFSEEDSYVAQHKACLNVLIESLYKKLYYDAARFIGSDVALLSELDKQLDSIVGNFQGTYEEANSAHLKELLNQQVLTPLLQRIQEEKQQRLAVCLGSRSNLKDQKGRDYSINTAYFKNSIFERNTVALMFSYLHEATPMPVNEMEEKNDSYSLSTSLRKNN